MSDTKDIIKIDDGSSWEEALENELWVSPLVNVYETKDDYFLAAALPGVARENIKIKLEDNTLIIMGRINYGNAVNRNYLLQEMEPSNYFRRFNLSKNVKTDKIEARYENGELTIRLPKHDGIKPRNIEIE